MAVVSARRPAAGFVTVSAEYLGDQSFSSALSAEAKQMRRSKVLVFVHGFNNRFDEAVYRLAQIAHDSNAPPFPSSSPGHHAAKYGWLPMPPTVRVRAAPAMPFHSC